jgi:hypothetical protein
MDFRSVGLPTFMAELLESHRLLFSTAKSENIAQSLRKNHKNSILEINLDHVRDYRANWSEHSLQVTDFPIYGSRLQHIHQTMADWRPLRLKDVRFRPYHDPLPYYGFWFALFIGFAAIISLILSSAQLGMKC